MNIHFQPALYFHLVPRIRVYRRPLQIWLCWLGTSAHIHDIRNQPDGLDQ